MDGWMNKQKKNEQINKEINTECLLDARNRDRHFYIIYLSTYDLEEQHLDAHKEVTPQVICKQLLVKNQKNSIQGREYEEW